MVKPAKVATVADIADSFRNSSAAVITEYRGLTMSQLTTLRKNLGSDTAYTVAKNTLVKRAAADAGIEGLDELFTGPTAVAFIGGEPVDAAKVLRDFSRANPLLVIKGGLLEGKPLDAAEVTKLADLESREVLLGKMAGAMLATLTKAAVVLNALPSQIVRLAAALVEKRTEAEGAPEAPADALPTDVLPADAEPADAAPADAAPADAVPGDAVPADEVPADPVPGDDAVPGDAVPAEAVPADELSADAVAGEAAVDEAPAEPVLVDAGSADAGVEIVADTTSADAGPVAAPGPETSEES